MKVRNPSRNRKYRTPRPLLPPTPQPAAFACIMGAFSTKRTHTIVTWHFAAPKQRREKAGETSCFRLPSHRLYEDEAMIGRPNLPVKQRPISRRSNSRNPHRWCCR
ncbi:protein of unknown function [Azospirillum baldaniorum]|uniref:Uncharacterized protein n=1 Tax=Azospirillum baldaniorum TaxID=1064539 RepID=A0A9P1JQW8_9PROT|nr:protein of unknown function [Azospirillum baldaniorum]